MCAGSIKFQLLKRPRQGWGRERDDVVSVIFSLKSRLLYFFFAFLQVVWFFTCFGVILLGVDVGLGVGVICTLFAVVLTLSR